MHSYSRELTLLGLLSATLWLPQCSLLTKVDWSIIPPAGGASSGGSSGTIGDAGAEPVAGEGGLGGMAGDGAMAGEGGEGGGAGESEGGGGFGGSVAGGAGKGGSGGAGATGGNGGSGGAQAGAPGHTTCSTAPAVPAVIPDLSPFIVLFDGGTVTNGKRGGRDGLRTVCETAKAKLNLPQAKTEAVISVSAISPTDANADQIVNMKTKYKIPADSKAVVSPIGKQMAPTWNDFWRSMGELPSLVCSGVMPPTVTRWLSGSSGKPISLEMVGSVPGPAYYGQLDASTDLSGAQFANACNGWTLDTSSLSSKAHVGSTIADRDPGSDGHPRFVDFLNVECDAVTANVLCVAFDPTP